MQLTLREEMEFVRTEGARGWHRVGSEASVVCFDVRSAPKILAPAARAKIEIEGLWASQPISVTGREIRENRSR